MGNVFWFSSAYIKIARLTCARLALHCERCVFPRALAIDGTITAARAEMIATTASKSERANAPERYIRLMSTGLAGLLLNLLIWPHCAPLALAISGNSDKFADVMSAKLRLNVSSMLPPPEALGSGRLIIAVLSNPCSKIRRRLTCRGVHPEQTATIFACL